MKLKLALTVAAIMASTAAPAATLADLIRGDMPQLMTLYRDLHANPELSMQEVRTPTKLAPENELLPSTRYFDLRFITPALRSAWGLTFEICARVRRPRPCRRCRGQA